jgi:hypothetical protein
MKLKNIRKKRDENEKSCQTMSNIKDVQTAIYLPDIIGTIRKTKKETNKKRILCVFLSASNIDFNTFLVIFVHLTGLPGITIFIAGYPTLCLNQR